MTEDEDENFVPQDLAIEFSVDFVSPYSLPRVDVLNFVGVDAVAQPAQPQASFVNDVDADVVLSNEKLL